MIILHENNKVTESFNPTGPNRQSHSIGDRVQFFGHGGKVCKGSVIDRDDLEYRVKTDRGGTVRVTRDELYRLNESVLCSCEVGDRVKVKGGATGVVQSRDENLGYTVKLDTGEVDYFTGSEILSNLSRVNESVDPKAFASDLIAARGFEPWMIQGVTRPSGEHVLIVDRDAAKAYRNLQLGVDEVMKKHGVASYSTKDDPTGGLTITLHESVNESYTYADFEQAVSMAQQMHDDGVEDDHIIAEIDSVLGAKPGLGDDALEQVYANKQDVAEDEPHGGQYHMLGRGGTGR